MGVPDAAQIITLRRQPVKLIGGLPPAPLIFVGGGASNPDPHVNGGTVGACRERSPASIKIESAKSANEVDMKTPNDSAVNMYPRLFRRRSRSRSGKSKKPSPPATRPTCRSMLERFRRAAAERDKQCIGPGRFRLRANEFQGSRDPAAGWPAHERRVLCRMSFAAGDWRGRVVHQRNPRARQYPAGPGGIFSRWTIFCATDRRPRASKRFSPRGWRRSRWVAR